MRVTVCISLVFMLSAPAPAHHGFGSFDMSREITIEGVVTDLAFVNPHSWLYLDVTDENGERTAWRCELRSATTLRRSGWTPEMFPAGTRVTIAASPDGNDPTACYVSTIVFADGSSIDRYGQRTPATGTVGSDRPYRRPDGAVNLAGEWAAEQLVMSDPRGVDGSLVPLSEAERLAAQGDVAGDTPGRAGRVPLIAGDAAARLFIGSVPLTEAGEAARARAAGELNPAMRCEPISILMDWSYDSPVNRIEQDEATIRLWYGKFGYVRTIRLDADRHPTDLEPSLTGHSIGRFEDDVLVVETIGLRAGPLTRGLVTSESLKLTESFSLDPETLALTREFIADDPDYFLEPYTGSDTVYPSNVPYAPSPCDDRSLF